MHKEEYQHMHDVEADHFWFRAKAQFLKIAMTRCRIPLRARILDVGCGTGQTLKNLHTWGYAHAQGIDTSVDAAQWCRTDGLRAQEYQGDALPFPPESFDLIICLDVLEHVSHDHALVSEFARVLAPDGACIAMVPAHPRLWSYHDEAMGHYRRYTRTQMRALFQQAGLHTSATSPLHTALFLPFLIFRALKSHLSSHPQSDTTSLRFLAPLNALLFPLLYLPELIWFRLFGKLPFGNSLLLIARKEKRPQ